MIKATVLAVAIYLAVNTDGKLAKIKTPPMGWMDWEVFRCTTNCSITPVQCVSEQLFVEMAERIVNDGYAEAGYRTLSIDDCWSMRERGSDGKLHEDRQRFQHGMLWLSRHMQSLNLSLGSYLDIGEKTCGGFPGTQGYEETDAITFAEWEMDYIKLDGCYATANYEDLYRKFGQAINHTNREIVYSCSWPAYLQPDYDEKAKPFDKFVDAGCSLWRNWLDIQCSSGSLFQIIDHFGNYSKFLAQHSGKGGFNDMDMLLIGNDCITLSEAEAQMGIWSIMASPLIMGNDLRKVQSDHRSILLNREAIAINQDPLALPGFRISPYSANSTELWARKLDGSSIAVGVLNKSMKELNATFTLAEVQIGLGSENFADEESYVVRDVFKKITFDSRLDSRSKLSTTVPPHGLKLFRFTPLSIKSTMSVE